MERHIKIVVTISKYFDIVLKKDVYLGEIIEVDRDRAIKICKLGYAKIYSITKE